MKKEKPSEKKEHRVFFDPEKGTTFFYDGDKKIYHSRKIIKQDK